MTVTECVSTDEENMAASLQGASCAAIVKGLGKTATGIFTCGGTLQTPHTVQLAYRSKSGQWSGATFPGLKDADFQPILESSKVASFGRGKETVTDKSYRDAYVLEPNQFLSSFQLSDTDILREIRLILVPDVESIRAELYKMNIYTAPNGCFKAHIDTPRGGNMFGSLVVCLPSQFSGGALVTRHNGQEITYDWSSPGDNPVQKVQWAAFYSDVEHEILTVTKGHRVTLTYNLYHCEGPSLELDMTTSPFYNDLKAALDHPHFLRNGGTLGLACQHMYVFDEPNEPLANLSLLLKGSDRTVVLAAKSLDLTVQVRPMYDFRWDYDESYEAANEEEQFILTYVDKEFKFNEGWLDEWPYIGVRDSKNMKQYRRIERDITWCQELNWKLAVTTKHYGNEATEHNLYHMAAILVTIPQWSERHGPSIADTSTIDTDEPTNMQQSKKIKRK